MNNLKENASKLMPLLQAVLDGKTVQYKSPEQRVWVDAFEWSLLVTDFEYYEYRVKMDPVSDFAEKLIEELNRAAETTWYKPGFQHAIHIVTAMRDTIVDKGVCDET